MNLRASLTRELALSLLVAPMKDVEDRDLQTSGDTSRQPVTLVEPALSQPNPVNGYRQDAAKLSQSMRGVACQLIAEGRTAPALSIELQRSNRIFRGALPVGDDERDGLFDRVLVTKSPRAHARSADGLSIAETSATRTSRWIQKAREGLDGGAEKRRKRAHGLTVTGGRAVKGCRAPGADVARWLSFSVVFLAGADRLSSVELLDQHQTTLLVRKGQARERPDVLALSTKFIAVPFCAA